MNAGGYAANPSRISQPALAYERMLGHRRLFFTSDTSLLPRLAANCIAVTSAAPHPHGAWSRDQHLFYRAVRGLEPNLSQERPIHDGTTHRKSDNGAQQYAGAGATMGC